MTWKSETDAAAARIRQDIPTEPARPERGVIPNPQANNPRATITPLDITIVPGGEPVRSQP